MLEATLRDVLELYILGQFNDLTLGWRHLNLLSHPNATLAPQTRASGENFNYVTLALQARQARPSV